MADPTRAFGSFNDYKTDVEPVLADANVLQKVVAAERNLRMPECIGLLHDIARLLECAMVASHGQNYHASIIGLAIKYQTLVDALRSASSTHLQTSMEALKHLKLAFFCLQKHECDDAKALLKALPTLAARSEEVASAHEKQVIAFWRDGMARLNEVLTANAHMSCAVRLAEEKPAHGCRALAQLEMTITALGRMKTCFEDVRMFWAMFKEHCYKIAGPNKISEASFMAVAQEDTDLLVEAMTKEWYRWLALAKTNYTAMCGMNDVQTTVRRILSTLPNSAESSLVKDLKSKLEENAALLQAQIEEQRNATVALYLL
ncbi:hypothetical protein SPRG_13016 [Saprolegnia parasitica CBS 223.65]|uniref:Uncharacterized protein n=1 Tax=Saprolegnia parasitica (strain CBS 223.65) TaxID=695850 RepID=A0A067BTW3_SAPPC|nr:hypothetical protein SPRG_13016 [Saprolegnia parasitica CBS 223.65]KDO21678.1 hypothetical protein SPRG_13016 [Saprolegnia parasitica CBS 223.65]|eukprot:XP_012207601.1 hypothetical protein SPRG_13016 [Saprolegnia parasitica CBS 223.65]